MLQGLSVEISWSKYESEWSCRVPANPSHATSAVVTRHEFDAALDDAVEEPAVGAPLPFPDLSLADRPVALDPSPDQLREAKTGVTGSPLGISSLGTVAVVSRAEGDEPVSLFPERHVVVLRAADLRPDLESTFDWLRDEFDAGRDSVVFETGPSAWRLRRQVRDGRL